MAAKRWAMFSVTGLMLTAISMALTIADVHPAQAQVGKSEVASDKITLDGRDVAVSDVLELLFNDSKQDYTIAPGVQGYITLKASDVPLETVLRLVANGSQVPLTVKQTNRIWVAEPTDPAENKATTLGGTRVAPTVDAQNVYQVPRRVAAVLLTPGREAAILINGPEGSPSARTRAVRVGDKVPSGLAGGEPLDVVAVTAKGVTLAQNGKERVKFLVPLKARTDPSDKSLLSQY